VSGARFLACVAVGLAALAATDSTPVLAEPVTEVQRLLDLADRFEIELAQRRPALWSELRARRTPAFAALHDDPDLELAFLGPRNRPFWLRTENLDAARTVSSDDVWPGGSGGFAITGAGATPGRLGVWDAGGVRTSHQEFGGRATQIDSPSSTHYHSTHVAGTLIASGVDGGAKGMSPAGRLDCYDWDSDTSEMATAAAGGMWLSNHSYGYVTGWYWSSSSGNWYWYGDLALDPTEDSGFGFYSFLSVDWDQIAYDAPYYLIVKSAGNDRNDDGPGPGGGHYHWDNDSSSWVWATDTHQADGGDGGYDTISWAGVSKNILTVAAVDDIPGGWSGPGSVDMSSFSGWGPTDDGRIKPDVSANGIALWSTMDGSDSDYASLSGTSMASPNACGSTNLVIDYHGQSHGGTYPTAAMTKAILVQTADEAGGADGPDYAFGWGLLNTLSAVQLVDDDANTPGHLVQATLFDGANDEYWFTLDAAGPVRITIAWTDPPGTPPADGLDPPDLMLVNDLDLRLSDEVALATWEPWVLDPASPSDPATTGDNFRDNVEQIHVDVLPAGDYVVRITHKASLTDAEQDYAIASSVALSDTPPATGVSVLLDRDPATLDVAVAPNPFGSATAVAFSMPHPGRARLEIVDVRGRIVRVLVDDEIDAGLQRVDWDGRDEAGRRLASGVYFARLTAADAGAAQKIVLLRAN
jgi:hypothetical protein